MNAKFLLIFSQSRIFLLWTVLFIDFCCKIIFCGRQLMHVQFFVNVLQYLYKNSIVFKLHVYFLFIEEEVKTKFWKIVTRFSAQLFSLKAVMQTFLVFWYYFFWKLKVCVSANFHILGVRKFSWLIKVFLYVFFF